MKKNNPEIKLVRKPIVKNLVLVSGCTRSGKVLLCPIISSLERAENIRLDHLAEQFTMLHSLGLMSDEVAVYLLRYSINFMLYEIYIGRNANFRPSDYTSIWNTADPKKFFNRLLAEEGDIAFERIEKENPIFVLMYHNALWYADVLFEAFSQLKMLHMKRHPIDLVFSWYRKGYGGDFSDNPRNAALTLEWKSKILSYYAVGWEKEYIKLSEMDRVIHIINRITDRDNDSIRSLSRPDRKKVMVVTFEDMVTNPTPILKKICNLLDTHETAYTQVVLQKEKCFRPDPKEERKKKFDKIKKLASPQALKLLIQMTKQYESGQGI